MYSHVVPEGVGQVSDYYAECIAAYNKPGQVVQIQVHRKDYRTS